jgi:dTDP-4-amino-4,6-dideoxygalactose transaminase
MALLLACKYLQVGKVTIPRRTYVSVPQSVIHAGGTVEFEDLEWRGAYQLKPYPIFDAARRFSSDMFHITEPDDVGIAFGPQKMVCVSFHASKILGIEQGGAILHGMGRHADEWLRRARFDGRTEGVSARHDDIREIGYHCYMNPSTAAQGLLKMFSLPQRNPDLPNSDYPDLSSMGCFK